MNKLLKRILTIGAVILTAVTVVFVTTAAGDRMGYPPTICDSTGTNTVTWADPMLYPTLYHGTNVYYGLWTGIGASAVTNVACSNAAGWVTLSIGPYGSLTIRAGTP